jgi:starch phosphorylase
MAVAEILVMKDSLLAAASAPDKPGARDRDPIARYAEGEGKVLLVAGVSRDLVEKGHSFDAALAEIRETTVFTTHTPVPAGHDAFPFQLVGFEANKP